MTESYKTQYRVLEMNDLFRTKEEATQEFVEDCNEYLKHFAWPTANADGSALEGDHGGLGICIKCGTEWNGFHHALGTGHAVAWGLAHGEGFCTNCRWPVRGMHYAKDRNGEELFTMRNLFLCYHPDYVDDKKDDPT